MARGPKPSFHPHFTPEQVAQARQVAARHTEAHVKVLRARMVLALAEHPDLSTPELARQVGVHEQTARKWRKRWATEGFGLEDRKGRGRKSVFSPQQVTQVRVIACEMPAQRGVPLSRFSLRDLKTEVEQSPVICSISTATIWRILTQDAIRPWYHRSWIFPQDPLFLEKAGPVLELYQGRWEGKPLGKGVYVLAADEKTQLQALHRTHPTRPPHPDACMRVEYEYERKGTVAYLAALDVFSGKVFGRVEPTTGIAPFSRLVDQVMTQEPYVSGEKIFWLVDNGSSHHPSTFPTRLREAYPKAVAVHLPKHASWLNQIELYFSILQRKALTPNDFENLEALTDRLLAFQERYNRTACPFTWKFTRKDLEERLRLAA